MYISCDDIIISLSWHKCQWFHNFTSILLEYNRTWMFVLDSDMLVSHVNKTSIKKNESNLSVTNNFGGSKHVLLKKNKQWNLNKWIFVHLYIFTSKLNLQILQNLNRIFFLCLWYNLIIIRKSYYLPLLLVWRIMLYCGPNLN